MSDWCLIESDPGVFTELLEQVGVKGVELEELWTLEDDVLANLGKFYGLIFLFQWNDGQDTRVGQRVPLETIPPDLFFAKQVTTNACATQALLSIILNNPEIELGKTLQEFKGFTASFPPDLKGEAIGASAELQNAHNSFARKDSFLHEGKQISTGQSEDIFHFVAYIPHDGKVYELDGLQTGPIHVGDVPEKDPWYKIARNAVQERMNASNGVKFNLMALIGDKRVELKEKVEKSEDSSTEKASFQADLAQQQAKHEQWRLENERRRHNYVPLCVELLKALAKKGDLPELVTAAQERIKAKREKKN